MRGRPWKRIGITLIAPLASSCMSGLIYTHIREPLTTNFDRTPAATPVCGDGEIKHLHVPFSTVDFDVLWNSNAIGDIAKKMGLAEIYYADLETMSIVSIWNCYTVHVYGRAAPTAPTAQPEIRGAAGDPPKP